VILTSFETLAPLENSDCVIIGSGFAGMILARRLRSFGQKIVVIESGAILEPHRWALSASSFAKADYRMGKDYLDLHVQRLFGGGSIVWGGWCAAMRSANFMKERFPGYAGWPIPWQALASHYAAAGEVLGLKKAADIAREEIEIPGSSDVAVKPYDLSPPVRINIDWLEATRQDPDLVLLTETTVEALQEGPEGVRLQLRARSGRTGTLVAPRVVVAAGSVIGATLLAASADQLNIPKGSQAHIGRHLLEHPYIYSAGSLIMKPSLAGMIRNHPWWFSNFLSLVPSMRVLETLKTPDFHLLLSRVSADGQTPQQNAALESFHAVSGEKGDLYSAILGFEMLPNTGTQVTSHKKIGPDLPFEGDAEVSVRFDDTAQATAKTALSWFRNAVASTFIEPQMPTDIVAVGHLMGTTRMAAQEDEGVVDANLKVFGAKRTYLCGSSVFPTSGFVNPTLTIGALALRLADHLRSPL
jgi:hypothetical protein